MSNSSHPNLHLEQCLQHDGTQPSSLRELTLTPVEWPLTATQEHNMCLVSQEPELPEEREINKIALEIPPALPNLMSNSTYNPSPNTANLDLHALLLALTNQTNNLPKKRNRRIKESDSFSRSNSDELRAFIF